MNNRKKQRQKARWLMFYPIGLSFDDMAYDIAMNYYYNQRQSTFVFARRSGKTWLQTKVCLALSHMRHRRKEVNQ
jgi:hypothetical protein